MLVLSRKVGERIVIAGDIEIEVVRILGSRVVVGVNAPAQVTVHRFEVHLRKLDQAHLDCLSLCPTSREDSTLIQDKEPIGRGVQEAVLIEDAEVLEILEKIDTVV